MSLSDTFKRMGQPFDPRTGFYAITALLFINTYGAFFNEIFMVDSKLNIENIVIFLLCYFLFLHLISPSGRFVLVFIQLVLILSIDQLFKTNISGFQWFPELKERDGYYRKGTIEELSIDTKNSLLNDLVRKCELDEKKFNQVQNGIFTLAILIPFNYFNGGFISELLHSVAKIEIYVIGSMVVLSLVLFSTAMKEFKVKLDPQLYKKLAEESGFKSLHRMV